MPSKEARALDQWVKDQADNNLSASAELIEEHYQYAHEAMLKAFDYYYRNVRPGSVISLVITINPKNNDHNEGFNLQILHYKEDLLGGE